MDDTTELSLILLQDCTMCMSERSVVILLELADIHHRRGSCGRWRASGMPSAPSAVTWRRYSGDRLLASLVPPPASYYRLRKVRGPQHP